jgi:long-subunit acyl-CoA synthetase (AMP-forming)
VSYASLVELFELATTRNARRHFLGYRTSAGAPYVWLTYHDVRKRVLALAPGIRCLFANDSESEHMLAIYGENCVEWALVDLA